jgi:hypothetical protein
LNGGERGAGHGSHQRPELRTHLSSIAQFSDEALELVVAVRVFMANFTIAMIIVMVVVVIMMVVMHLAGNSDYPQRRHPDQAISTGSAPIVATQEHLRGLRISAPRVVCFAVRQQICAVDDDHIRASNLGLQTVPTAAFRSKFSSCLRWASTAATLWANCPSDTACHPRP